MELFNEFLSGKLQAVIDLMLASRPDSQKNSFTSVEIAELLHQNHVEENAYDVIRTFSALGILAKTGNNSFQISESFAVRRPLEPPISLLEQEYLNYVVSNIPEAESFLTSLDITNGCSTGSLSYIQAVKGRGDGSRISFRRMQVILQAITDRRTLRYTYFTKGNRRLRQDEQIPFRLEYNVYDGRWWLLLYLQEQERTVKVKLEHITDAVLGRPHNVTDKEIQTVICQKYLRHDRVQLIVRDERNAIERTFLMLGQNPELTARRKEDGSVEVAFSWFEYDREEIVKKLMYLGDAVTVLGPSEICGRLAERLRKALALQEQSAVN